MTLPMAIGASLLILLSVFNILYLRKKMRFLTATIAQKKRELAQLVWDAEQLRALVPAEMILPRPDAWSMACDGLKIVVREVERRQPALIVELGSGLSTIVMAAKLKQIGRGRIVAVDHDAAYAQRTRDFLRLNDLEEIVDVRVAGLKQRPGRPSDPPWYDETCLTDLDAIDILVVDGPPMPVHPEVRGGALPFFRARMSPDWLLVLDDAERAGERAILKSWQAGPDNVQVTLVHLQKTVALIEPAVAAVHAEHA